MITCAINDPKIIRLLYADITAAIKATPNDQVFDHMSYMKDLYADFAKEGSPEVEKYILRGLIDREHIDSIRKRRKQSPRIGKDYAPIESQYGIKARHSNLFAKHFISLFELSFLIVSGMVNQDLSEREVSEWTKDFRTRAKKVKLTDEFLLQVLKESEAIKKRAEKSGEKVRSNQELSDKYFVTVKAVEKWLTRATRIREEKSRIKKQTTKRKGNNDSK
jgi:hypothetical protein